MGAAEKGEGIRTEVLAEKEDSCFPEGLRADHFVHYTDVVRCLRSLIVTADQLYHTFAEVEHGLANVYGSVDLAMDSVGADQRTTESCKLQVHDSKVDIRKELEDLKVEVKAKLKVDDFEDIFHRPGKVRQGINAFDFYERLGSLFLMLRDTNVELVKPWGQFFPSYQYMTDSGEFLDLRVRPPGSNGLPTVEIARGGQLHRAGVSDLWQAVATLNGQEAWTWVTMQADLYGSYRSAGARLNNFLHFWASGSLPTRSSPFPDTEALIVGFPDGTEGKATIVFWPNDFEHAGLDDLNKNLIEVYHPWHLMGRWVDEYLTPRSVRKSAAVAQATVRRRLEEHGARARGSGGSVGGRPGRRFQPPSPDAELVGRWPEVSSDHSVVSPPMFAGYWIPSSKVAVLKVLFLTPSMIPGFGKSNGLDMRAMYEALFDLHYNLIAKAESSSRLILDLSDTQSGSSSIANVILQMIAPNLEKRTDICTESALKYTKFWDIWLKSFSDRWENAIKRVQAAREEDLVAMHSELKSLRGLAITIKHTLPFRRGLLQALLKSFDATDNIKHQKELFLALLRRPAVSFLNKYANFALFSLDSATGWYPFSGMVVDAKTEEPFVPDSLYFTESDVRKWGGLERRFTKRHMRDCKGPWELPYWGRFKHQWKEIAILSNGRCTGACSILLGKLQFAHGATVFTTGGVPGEMTDSSSSASPEALDWHKFRENVFFAGIIGDIFQGPDSNIGQQLRSSRYPDRQLTKVLPLPDAFGIPASFSVGLTYMQELGDDALPFEWYRIPGHRHYDNWDFVDPTSEDTWGPLVDIWKTMAAEDWASVRHKGAFNGRYPDMYGCAAEPPNTTWVDPGPGGTSGQGGKPEWPPASPRGRMRFGTIVVWTFVAFLPVLIVLGMMLYLRRQAKRAAQMTERAQMELDRIAEMQANMASSETRRPQLPQIGEDIELQSTRV